MNWSEVCHLSVYTGTDFHDFPKLFVDISQIIGFVTKTVFPNFSELLCYFVVPLDIRLGVFLLTRSDAIVFETFGRFVFVEISGSLFSLRKSGWTISEYSYQRSAAVLAYDKEAHGGQK